MSVTVKFWCEAPWVNCELEDEFEFDDDVSDAEIDEAYDSWIHENFGGGWERVEADDE